MLHVACRFLSRKTFHFLIHERLLTPYLPPPETLLWAKDDLGKLPIHVACRSRWFWGIEKLLRLESEINKESNNETLPFDQPLMLYTSDIGGNLPIHVLLDHYFGGETDASECCLRSMLEYDFRHASCANTHWVNNFDVESSRLSMIFRGNKYGTTILHSLPDSGVVGMILQHEYELYSRTCNNASTEKWTIAPVAQSLLLFSQSTSSYTAAMVDSIVTMLTYERKWIELQGQCQLTSFLLICCPGRYSLLELRVRHLLYSEFIPRDAVFEAFLDLLQQYKSNLPKSMGLVKHTIDLWRLYTTSDGSDAMLGLLEMLCTLPWWRHLPLATQAWLAAQDCAA